METTPGGKPELTLLREEHQKKKKGGRLRQGGTGHQKQKEGKSKTREKKKKTPTVFRARIHKFQQGI